MLFEERDGYIVREISDADKEQIEAWWKQDVWHGHNPFPKYMAAPIENKTYTVAFEDEDGVVVYATFTRSLRVNLQFAPRTSRLRNSRMFLRALNWVEQLASSLGCVQVMFTQSENPKLTNIFKRLGFKHRNDYVKDEQQWSR